MHPFWEEMQERNGKYSFIHHFIVEDNGKHPMAFCQYYDCTKTSAEHPWADESSGTYGIDYWIGKKNLLGIGKQIIRLICDKVVAEESNAYQIIADPSVEHGNENVASIKVLEANGFRYDEETRLYKKNCNSN